MILDTGAFVSGDAVKPADPVRLARALRTLARVLELASPALEKAPRWGWVASLALDVVIDLAKGYAAKLDATGLEPNGHGWRTDIPTDGGRYLVTVCRRDGMTVGVYMVMWDGMTWDESVISEWHRVVAWQPLPPPYRGDV